MRLCFFFLKLGSFHVIELMHFKGGGEFTFNDLCATEMKWPYTLIYVQQQIRRLVLNALYLINSLGCLSSSVSVQFLLSWHLLHAPCSSAAGGCQTEQKHYSEKGCPAELRSQSLFYLQAASVGELLRLWNIVAVLSCNCYVEIERGRIIVFLLFGCRAFSCNPSRPAAVTSKG